MAEKTRNRRQVEQHCSALGELFEEEKDIIFQDLAHITLYPSFLSKALLTLPLTPVHRVESGYDEHSFHV
jgi:hypothetical protein